MRRCLLLLLPLLALPACEPPPAAPQGLDEASSFVIREFYSSDASFQAGLQGFMNWYFDEGEALVGLKPGLQEGDEPTDSFTVGRLTPNDVAHLPPNPDGVTLDNAAGVVSLAEMGCPWQVAEDFLVDPDQSTVFDAWDAYERTFINSETEFNTATDELSFTPINESLDVLGGTFDADAISRTILFTENQADPAVFAGVNVEPYQLFLDIRHGVFDLTDQETGETTPTGVFAIMTYITHAAYDASESNGLLQSYSVEINVQRPGDKTLRMLAVWAEPLTILNLPPDDPLVLNQSVGTALDQSQQLDEKCSAWAEANPVETPSTTCNAGGGTGSGLLGLWMLPMLLRRRRR